MSRQTTPTDGRYLASRAFLILLTSVGTIFWLLIALGNIFHFEIADSIGFRGGGTSRAAFAAVCLAAISFCNIFLFAGFLGHGRPTLFTAATLLAAWGMSALWIDLSGILLSDDHLQSVVYLLGAAVLIVGSYLVSKSAPSSATARHPQVSEAP